MEPEPLAPGGDAGTAVRRLGVAGKHRWTSSTAFLDETRRAARTSCPGLLDPLRATRGSLAGRCKALRSFLRTPTALRLGRWPRASTRGSAKDRGGSPLRWAGAHRTPSRNQIAALSQRPPRRETRYIKAKVRSGFLEPRTEWTTVPRGPGVLRRRAQSAPRSHMRRGGAARRAEGAEVRKVMRLDRNPRSRPTDRQAPVESPISKPVWLMSRERLTTPSQLGNGGPLDLVVFDESQVRSARGDRGANLASRPPGGGCR